MCIETAEDIESRRPSVAIPATSSSALDAINARVYHAQQIVKKYQWSELDHREVVVLLNYQPAFRNRDVLDIGVGTGRTTRYLAPLSRRYECLDYSPAMVRFLHNVMPDISARLADMRDLSMFMPNTFDFVLATNCVISAVSHADRLRVLHEVRRVMRPNGVFVFSAHNRRYRHALSAPRLQLTRNPVRQGQYAAAYLRSLINYARLRHHRRIERDYALLNDSGHDYALLHYYIDRDTQQQQLQAAGFTLLETYDRAGHVLQASAADVEHAHLMYVAQRN
jgi:SAM-dependent methyltransferase